jgi:hypothetical protein
MYGTDPSNLTEETLDSRDTILSTSNRFSHHVNVRGLSPETKYYYEIISGEQTFNNNGVPFEITTYSTLDSPPPYKTVSGEVENVSNPEDTIVLTKITGSEESGYISTTVDANSTWIMSIGDARNSDGSAYLILSDTDQLAFNLLGYLEAETVTETGENIEEKNIVLTGTSGSRAISKIEPLSDYGVSQL